MFQGEPILIGHGYLIRWEHTNTIVITVVNELLEFNMLTVARRVYSGVGTKEYSPEDPMVVGDGGGGRVAVSIH